MKYFTLCVALILTGAALQCSCGSPHTVAFNEAAFFPYRGSGSGIVKGTAFLIMEDGSKLLQGDQSTVLLFPRTAYTDEIVRTEMKDARRMQRSDPRFAKYLREVPVDNQGRFECSHLPPGDYYVGAGLRWTYPDTATLAEGGVETIEAESGQWFYTRCTVKNGQITNIASWNQGNLIRYR